MMTERGTLSSIYISENVDSGPDHNERLKKEYARRIYRK